MNDTAPQAALREMRRRVAAPPALAAMAGIAALATLSGAFGTDESLRAGPRFVYWAILVAATYAAGVAIGAALGPRLRARGWGRGRRAVALSAATAFGVTGVVLAINAAAFGPPPLAWPTLLRAGEIAAVAAIVTALLLALEWGDPAAAGEAAPPPILARLPLERRGPLVALSVEDHYVRVRTVKGEDMVLMRLGDAIGETGATRGLQVHRSHWVALDQVAAVRRAGDRAILTMRHGPEIPASRARLPALRAAGLLAR